MLPWMETNADLERQRLVLLVEEHGWPVIDAAYECSVSRKTAHKWLGRHRAWGDAGLTPLSRAPSHHPNATPSAVAEAVVEAKRLHGDWGPKKLVAWLAAASPETAWPAASTAGAILARAGLVERRRRRRRSAPFASPHTAPEAPNDCWAMDFKGWFLTADGKRLDPFTVQDSASRFLVCCEGLERPTGVLVRRVLEAAFREWGLPRALRSDNGPPFAGAGVGSLSPLAVWLVKLGVVPERIAPGHPEQNGRLERLHRTLKAATAAPPHADRWAQQAAFDAFRRTYNGERPHEALGQQPPAQFYAPSPRPYPAVVRSPEYGEEFSVRQVRGRGEIKWRGGLLYVSKALVGEPIGLMQRTEDAWDVRFGPLLIGVLNERTQRIDKTAVNVLPMCPG